MEVKVEKSKKLKIKIKVEQTDLDHLKAGLSEILKKEVGFGRLNLSSDQLEAIKKLNAGLCQS